jgi:predicted nucleic acid-binding protein
VILLDTTVLSYAVGTDHPLRAPCRRLLEAHRDGAVEAATTVEALQEFVHVRSRRRSRDDAAALAREYAQALHLIPTGPDDLERALDLFVQHPALGAFDAFLAAVAVGRHLEALVSADRAFGSVATLRWIDPGSPAAMDALIRR